MTEERRVVSSRKDHHLDIVLRQEVGSRGVATGLGCVLEYDALPEVDLDEVCLGTRLFGRALKAPLILGAMTGGSERSGRVNERLARLAARHGVALALGSQRAMVLDPSLTWTYDVRAHADVPLVFGNVGAVQLNYGMTADALREAVLGVRADVLNIHLNPLQEAVQPEGDTRFGGLAAKLASVVPALPFPVVIKEVGAGLSSRTLAKLRPLPIAGVEVAGVGGTSWARVESHRAPEGSRQRAIGERLAGFGVSTVESLRLAREAFADRIVVASGGIRTALDVAVALALGADAVALAAPVLERIEASEEAADAWLGELLHELRVLAFCTGSRDLAALRSVRVERA